MTGLLVSRPNKIFDESLEGYIIRLSHINFTEIKHFGIKQLNQNSNDEEVKAYLNKIKELTGIVYDDDHLLYRWFSDGFTIPDWKRFSYTRFCPDCLKNSLYHRYYWTLSISTYCYEHQNYLLEFCLFCNNHIQINDVVSGQCGQCRRSLTESIALSAKFERESIFRNEIRISDDSPYLELFLTKKEYLRLVHQLSYCIGVKVFDLKLSAEERMRFSHLGYLVNTIQLYEINNLVMGLLEGWPSELMFYLNNHFKGVTVKVKGLLQYLIRNMPVEHITKVLLRTHEREKGFGNSFIRNIDDEQRIFDRFYLAVQDVIEHHQIDHQTLHEHFDQKGVILRSHPRTKLLCVHKSELDNLESLKKNSTQDKYIPDYEVALIWNTSSVSARVLCDFFDVEKRVLLMEDCYKSTDVINLVGTVKEYVTSHELIEKTIWSRVTIKWYLKKKSVSLINDEHLKEIYRRVEVFSVLSEYSFDFNFYVSRREALDELGEGLFRSSMLDPYYISVRSRYKPFYLKSDVAKMLTLYEEVQDLKKINSIRHKEKWNLN